MTGPFKIRMSEKPVELDKLRFGFYREGDTYYGPAWVATAEATREEFISYLGEDMTLETWDFLASHSDLHFYYIREYGMEAVFRAIVEKGAE